MRYFNIITFLSFGLALFSGCMQGYTTAGSPELLVDYTSAVDYLAKEAKAASVDLISIEERNSDQKLVSADLRIDLIKPELFSDLRSDNNARAKELVRWTIKNLKDPQKYNSFSVNEVTEKSSTTPDPNIQSTIKLQLKDL